MDFYFSNRASGDIILSFISPQVIMQPLARLRRFYQRVVVNC
jgi:hypothetical protein